MSSPPRQSAQLPPPRPTMFIQLRRASEGHDEGEELLTPEELTFSSATLSTTYSPHDVSRGHSPIARGHSPNHLSAGYSPNSLSPFSPNSIASLGYWPLEPAKTDGNLVAVDSSTDNFHPVLYEWARRHSPTNQLIPITDEEPSPLSSDLPAEPSPPNKTSLPSMRANTQETPSFWKTAWEQ
jgi:hypothetical protein